MFFFFGAIVESISHREERGEDWNRGTNKQIKKKGIYGYCGAWDGEGVTQTRVSEARHGGWGGGVSTKNPQAHAPTTQAHALTRRRTLARTRSASTRRQHQGCSWGGRREPYFFAFFAAAFLTALFAGRLAAFFADFFVDFFAAFLAGLFAAFFAAALFGAAFLPAFLAGLFAAFFAAFLFGAAFRDALFAAVFFAPARFTAALRGDAAFFGDARGDFCGEFEATKATGTAAGTMAASADIFGNEKW